MVDTEIEKDGFKIELTGEQVRLVRNILGESLPTFARRFARDRLAIMKIEKRSTEKQTGPIIILVHHIAKLYGITIPDVVRVRADGADAGAVHLDSK